MNDGVAAGTAVLHRGTAPDLSTARSRARSQRRLTLAAGALLMLLVAAGATWWLAGRTAAVHYTTTAVTRGTVARTVTATGTVNPVLTVIVGTAVSGIIIEVQCDYNTKVKKGQICAKIDPRPYQSVVDQDTANLAVAKAQLQKDQASLDYTKANAGRTAWLERNDSIARDAADLSRSAFHQAQAQVVLDAATIRQWEAQLATAQVNLGYTDIVSPVDGTVVSRNVTVGQTVAASFQTPTLFLIASDLTKMEVDTNVSESDIGSVKDDDPASFTVEAFPDRAFQGKVTQVRQAPQTIQNVVTFDVVIDVANPDLLLVPGMTATTKIVTAQRDDVVRVPDQALRYLPAEAAAAPAQAPAQTPAQAPATPARTAGAPAPRQGQVWVLADGKPVAVPVTLGLDDDSFTEIVGGALKPDDLVILSEQHGGAGATGRSAVPLPRL